MNKSINKQNLVQSRFIDTKSQILRKQNQKKDSQIAVKKNQMTAYEEIYHSLQIDQNVIKLKYANEHSIVCLLHIVLKVIPFLVYFIDTLFNINSDLLIIQLTIVFLVIDFWYTKNISGRFLIGMRWWIGEDQYQNEILKIEYRINDNFNPKITSKVFWFTLLVFQLGTIAVLAFSFWKFNLSNILLALVMILFGGINLWCFFRARKKERKQKYLNRNSVIKQICCWEDHQQPIYDCQIKYCIF